MILPYYKNKIFQTTLVLVASLIVSCSSTNRNLSEEGKILSQKTLVISSFNLSVNGKEIQNFDAKEPFKQISGIDALIFGAKNYGVFVVSTEKFKKSEKAGIISSKSINFEINDLAISINPTNGSLTNIRKKTSIWVRQMHNRKSKSFSFDSQPYSTLNNSTFLETLPWPNYTLKNESSQSNSGNSVLKEEVAQVVGGMKSIMSKVKYPSQAIEDNVSGVVRIRFVVGEDGNTYDFEFINRLGSGCDQEALKAIKYSEFIPGNVNGYAAPTVLTIPIYFRR